MRSTELSRALEAGEWLGVSMEDDKEADALFGMTRRLWVATRARPAVFEEPLRPCAIFTTDSESSAGVIPGVLKLVLTEGRVASPDVKALLHEIAGRFE